MPETPKGIERLLADQLGLNPAAVGPSLIARAVRLRMSNLGLNAVRDYDELVRNSRAELDALVEEVIVPESWFFRDEHPFHWFQQHVRQGWLVRPQRPKLRVLSLPCAAGEEPYSIVISLSEIGLPPERFHVDAVDISARRLDHARRGVYSPNAFRAGAHAFRDRDFQKHSQGYELNPAIRRQVRFLLGSAVDPKLLAGEPRYDVIFCRNLLIYLSPAALTQLMSTLDRLLAVDGHLVLGHADRIPPTPNGTSWEPIGGGTFTYRRTGATPPLPTFATPLGFAPFEKNLEVSVARGQLHPETTSRLSRRELPAGTEPASGHDPHSLPPPPPSTHRPDRWGNGDRPGELAEPATAAELLQQAAELANSGKQDAALAVCQQSLRQRGPDAATYFLMGVIQQSIGDVTQAETSFHKAVYLDPAHNEALLALALLAERRGDLAAAVGFHRRAERALARKAAR